MAAGVESGVFDGYYSGLRRRGADGIGVGAERTGALFSATRCVEGVVDLVRESYPIPLDDAV
jgi:hypothetical protein